MITILLISTSFFTKKNEHYHPCKAEQLVNDNLIAAAQIIQKKYNLNPCGEGAAMHGGPIKKLILCFDTKTQHTKEELRKLLINCANELIDYTNKNKEIQPFLAKIPFTIENIEITIFNKNNGKEVYDPLISTAEVFLSILTYRTIDINDVFKFKTEYRESYAEALKMLNKTE